MSWQLFRYGFFVKANNFSSFTFNYKDEEDSFVMKAIIHAINDDNVPGLQHLLGSLTNYDINQPNKVVWVHVEM